MKRSILTLFFLVSLAVPTLAAETTPAASPIAETPAVAAAPAPVAQPVTPATPVRKTSRRLSPLAVAMNAVVESEAEQMKTLKARLVAAKDPATADAVQREIEQLKLDTEVQLLSLQAANHRQNGRIEAAVQLEESIRSLRAVPSVAAPRPAATPATR